MDLDERHVVTSDHVLAKDPDVAQVSLLLVPAIAERMDAMIARGHAHDDSTVIAKDFVER